MYIIIDKIKPTWQEVCGANVSMRALWWPQLVFVHAAIRVLLSSIDSCQPFLPSWVLGWNNVELSARKSWGFIGCTAWNTATFRHSWSWSPFLATFPQTKMAECWQGLSRNLWPGCPTKRMAAATRWTELRPLCDVRLSQAIVGCTDTSPNVASAGFTVSRIRLQRWAIHSILRSVSRTSQPSRHQQRAVGQRSVAKPSVKQQERQTGEQRQTAVKSAKSAGKASQAGLWAAPSWRHT